MNDSKANLDDVVSDNVVFEKVAFKPRVFDATELDAYHARGEPRGRASVVLVAAWMNDGARISVRLSGSALRCDICDGGGCDACGRSGAYRIPDSPDLPDEIGTIEITVPPASLERFAIRIGDPFGDRAPRMLILEVNLGDEPSRHVAYRGPHHDSPSRTQLEDIDDSCESPSPVPPSPRVRISRRSQALIVLFLIGGLSISIGLFEIFSSR